MVGNNLIALIEGIEKNTEFYMRVMPILKQERELISEKDYKEFIARNERVLCKSIEQNAYLALLMQEIEHKNSKEVRKWGEAEDQLLGKLVHDNLTLGEIQDRMLDFDAKEVQKKYQKAIRRASVQYKSS